MASLPTMSYHANNHPHTLTADFSRSFYRAHKHECTMCGHGDTTFTQRTHKIAQHLSPKPTTHDKRDVHSGLGHHTFEPVQGS
jgi:ribosomal protein L37E